MTGQHDTVRLLRKGVALFELVRFEKALDVSFDDDWPQGDWFSMSIGNRPRKLEFQTKLLMANFTVHSLLILEAHSQGLVVTTRSLFLAMASRPASTSTLTNPRSFSRHYLTPKDS